MGEMKQKQKQKQKRGHSPATCWLHLAGFQSTALAAHLGISLASVSHVLNGYRNDQPSPQFRKGLVELTDEATAQKIIDAIPGAGEEEEGELSKRQEMSAAPSPKRGR